MLPQFRCRSTVTNLTSYSPFSGTASTSTSYRLPPPPLMNPAPTPTPPSLTFLSPDALAEYLTPLLPPGSLACWGALPGTKTLHNLFLELSLGETSLLPSHPLPLPLRTVRVVTVRILNPRGAHLLESHQLLSDGSFRSRLRPLSEKMRPGESVEEAALRALREELGEPASARSHIVPGSCQVRVDDRASASYPGLPARYVLHSVEAQVEGLPQEDFETEEAGEGLEAQDGKAVFVRRHFWKWVDADGGRSSA